MVLEETSGASTVNGPDVLRISRQPWSGGRRGRVRMGLGGPQASVPCVGELWEVWDGDAGVGLG